MNDVRYIFTDVFPFIHFRDCNSLSVIAGTTKNM